jgi:hypothetical protein
MPTFFFTVPPPPSFKFPVSLTPSELPTQNHRQIPSFSLVRRRPHSVFLSRTSPRCQTSLVFRHTINCRYTPVLSIPNPRSRIFSHTLPKKYYRVPLTSRIKLPMMSVMSRTLSGFRMMCSDNQAFPPLSLSIFPILPMIHRTKQLTE